MLGIVYGQEVQANTLTGLKRKATSVANRYYNAVDELTVLMNTDTGYGAVKLVLTRTNKKSPNNEIRRGQWR